MPGLVEPTILLSTDVEFSAGSANWCGDDKRPLVNATTARITLKEKAIVFNFTPISFPHDETKERQSGGNCLHFSKNKISPKEKK